VPNAGLLQIIQRASKQPTVVDALMSALNEMSATDPGIGPMVAVTQKTVPLFEKALSASKNPLEQAISFLKIRYPRFFKQRGLTEILETPIFGETIGNTSSLVDDLGELIGIRINVDPKKVNYPELATEVLAHELTHANQARKYGPYWAYKFGNLPYETRPSEIQALSGGRTALKSYKNLRDLMQEKLYQQSIGGIK
jgi:hypothetical protein